MRKQVQKQVSILTMQEMMAQMVRMQAELDSLKARSHQRANTLTQPEEPSSSPQTAKITSTRRKTLKRLGLALLGGAVAATATGFAPAEAKLVVTNPSTTRVGAIILSPKALAPTGTAGGTGSTIQYGLIALARTDTTTAFNLSTELPAIGDIAVYGKSNGIGVYGVSGFGTGVLGTGTAFGVYGSAPSSGGTGLLGEGFSYGVGGTSSNGTGVQGISTNGYGVQGITSSTTNAGVYGSGSFLGVSGKGDSYGVYGVAGGGTTYTGSVTGIIGVSGNSRDIGVYGLGNNYGVRAIGGNYGVYAYGGNCGVYGESTGWAGYFQGDVNVTDTITAYTASAGVKNFKIDHPLDPENKYLYHTSIESPDMKNLYDGVVTLDGQGEAVVEMPDWFEALNFDFRYQLTCLGEYSPVFIAGEIKDRRFMIAGGQSGQRVSWQVTGIRQDAFAKAHRSPVEEDKTTKEKGLYLHPEAFGKSKEMSVNSLLGPK